MPILLRVINFNFPLTNFLSRLIRANNSSLFIFFNLGSGRVRINFSRMLNCFSSNFLSLKETYPAQSIPNATASPCRNLLKPNFNSRA